MKRTSKEKIKLDDKNKSIEKIKHMYRHNFKGKDNSELILKENKNIIEYLKEKSNN